jgi:hypothetical protein
MSIATMSAPSSASLLAWLRPWTRAAPVISATSSRHVQSRFLSLRRRVGQFGRLMST